MVVHLAKKHDKLNKLLEEYGLHMIELEVSDKVERTGSGSEEESAENESGNVKKERKCGSLKT